MAIIKCPECGREISDKAKICPNCGYAMKKQYNKKCGNGKLFSGLLLNIFSMLIILVYIVSSETWLFASDRSTDSANVHVAVTADISQNAFAIVADIWVALFIFGIIIYVIKNAKLKSIK